MKWKRKREIKVVGDHRVKHLPSKQNSFNWRAIRFQLSQCYSIWGRSGVLLLPLAFCLQKQRKTKKLVENKMSAWHNNNATAIVINNNLPDERSNWAIWRIPLLHRRHCMLICCARSFTFKPFSLFEDCGLIETPVAWTVTQLIMLHLSLLQNDNGTKRQSGIYSCFNNKKISHEKTLMMINHRPESSYSSSSGTTEAP